MALMGQDTIRKLSFEDLLEYTDGLSDENYIGHFQFGKVYRGKIKLGTKWAHDVTVKIWEQSKIYICYEKDNEDRLRDEVFLLQHESVNSHPNLVKLIGYCCESIERRGVVYDLNPLDTLYNLLLKDSFTWAQRIKVALGFAHLLEFLHTKGTRYDNYVVRNIDAANIMLDQDYNPILYDFSMICGGVLPNWSALKIQYLYGSYGYIDPSTTNNGNWSRKFDVFAFGVLLLGLIAKRVYTEEDRLSRDPSRRFVYEWARKEYKQKKSESKSKLGFDISNFSLVHESLEADPLFHPSDGCKLTRLAMLCVQKNVSQRPQMKQVFAELSKLCIVRRYAVALRMDKIVDGHRTLERHHYVRHLFLHLIFSRLPSNLKERVLDFWTTYSH